MPNFPDDEADLVTLRDWVTAALDEQGHNTAASLLAAGRWKKLDADGAIQVEVGVKKTMLGLTMNGDAWKIVRVALHEAGATRKMMVVPGIASSGSANASRASRMPTCFVIQPFDSGKFDKRYKETFAPAIIAAGFEPYRVDEDQRADVLITSIEDGIRSASVCLADITTDNPNVWFELGFAFAANRPVVMVCSTERTGKYPFDIQHRVVTSYKTEAQSDFKTLSDEIVERLRAVAERSQTLQQIAEAEPVAPVSGLSQIELTVLAVAAGAALPQLGFSLWSMKNDAEKLGLSDVGISLALRRLCQKQFFEEMVEDDGEDHIKERRLVPRGGIGSTLMTTILRFDALPKGQKPVTTEITDDDIPF